MMSNELNSIIVYMLGLNSDQVGSTVFPFLLSLYIYVLKSNRFITQYIINSRLKHQST